MYDDITLYYYSGFARPVVVLRTCIMVHCTLLVCVTHGLNAATVTPQRKKASMCPRVSKSDSGVLHGQKKAKFLHRSWVVICQNFFHFGFEAKIDVYPSRNPRHVETRQGHCARAATEPRDTSGHVEKKQESFSFWFIFSRPQDRGVRVVCRLRFRSACSPGKLLLIIPGRRYRLPG